MSKLYLITSILAISFFSYAQYRGMSFYGGGAQQFAKSGTGSGGGFSRSSSISHK